MSERLGGINGTDQAMLFPRRPKQMRWRTYERRRAAVECCVRVSLVAATARFEMPVGELGDKLL